MSQGSSYSTVTKLRVKRGFLSGRSTRFNLRPDRFWDPRSLLSMGTGGSFTAVKVAGAWN